MKKSLFRILITSFVLLVPPFLVAQATDQVFVPEEKLILLTSGESKELTLRQMSESPSSVECEYAWGNENVVLILPGCKIVAQYPGRVGLIFKRASSKRTHEIEIRVKPKKLGRYFNGKSLVIEIDKYIDQQWLLLTGLKAGEVYRADLTGLVKPGSRLRFIADNGRSNNSCGNTLAAESGGLACYFGATRDVIILAIDRAGEAPLKSNLRIQPVVDPLILENFAVITSAKNLAISKPVSGFVLANEIGTNSKHYFNYSVNPKISRRLQVKLFDFTQGIILNVTWVDGHCSAEQLIAQAGQIRCILPKNFLGDLIIVIDGNSVLPGQSLASDGGGFYRLVVEYYNEHD